MTGLALHKALFQALKASSIPWLDSVPQGTPYPYGTVTANFSVRMGFLSEAHHERFIYLDVWSQVRGQEEVLRVMGELEAMLHGRRLELDAGRTVLIEVDRAHARRDADGETYNGRVTLRVVTSS